MVRSDHLKFRSMSRHFEQIDAALCDFCRSGNWQARKNEKRQPGRELQRRGEVSHIIGIHLNDDWLRVDFRDDLPHTFGVLTVYRPVEDLMFLRRHRLIADQPFAVIAQRITPLLQEGEALLNSWSLPLLGDEGFDIATPGWQVSTPLSRKLAYALEAGDASAPL